MIRPIGNNILVTKIEKEKKKQESIIIIPETIEKDEKINMGVVVDIGMDEQGKELKIDDMIFFSKFAGEEIKFDGEKYIIIKREDVLAVIEE